MGLINHTSYLNELDPEIAALKVEMAVKKLRDFPFEAIAFTGMSGAIMAPMIGMKLKRPLILVRKASDNSHAYRFLEGALDAATYVIVDDFISSGSTICRIHKMIRESRPLAKCVGVYSYRYDALYTAENPEYESVKQVVSSVVIPSKPQTATCAFTGFPLIDSGETNMAACEQA